MAKYLDKKPSTHKKKIKNDPISNRNKVKPQIPNNDRPFFAPRFNNASGGAAPNGQPRYMTSSEGFTAGACECRLAGGASEVNQLHLPWRSN